MLKQELIHSHILVAILCGWEPQKPNKEFPNGYLILSDQDETENKELFLVSNDTILEELPYQTDWNYFMAAWKEFSNAVGDLDKEDQENEELLRVNNSIINAVLSQNQDLAFRELVRGTDVLNQLKLQET